MPITIILDREEREIAGLRGEATKRSGTLDILPRVKSALDDGES